jgi:hypothetical protein
MPFRKHLSFYPSVKQGLFMRVGVFCGSSLGHRPSYRHAVKKFGELLAQKKNRYRLWRHKRRLNGNTCRCCLK